jgi:thiol-disulfide isomerase/thioredoxin
MRTFLLITSVLFLSVFAHSQTIIEKPKIGMSTAPSVNIEKIELRDTATVLWFHVNQTLGNWIRIPKESYIQPVGSKEKLFIVSTDGIPLNERYTIPASGEVDYKLVFPKIESSVGKLDYGEGNEGGSWFIYNIQLKPELFKSIVPEKIIGNWFRSDNAQWEISLFDSVAIYKSQVWKIKQYSEKEGVGKIGLKNGSKSLYIFTKPINDSTCVIGETPAKLIKYSSKPDESVVPEDKEPFKLPVFKMDTVTYCGYIKGFVPRFPQHTGFVYVNNTLTGHQDSYLLKIADDGTFCVKFTHSNPQLVLLRFASLNELIFIEPGKSFFQMIDNSNLTSPSLFMGELSKINVDITKLKDINSLNYLELEKQSQKATPNEFKEYLMNYYTKDLSVIETLEQKNQICTRACQVWKMELDYRYGVAFMNYAREKNKIRDHQQVMSIKTDSSYFSFLTNDFVNNPIAVLTFDYSLFLNKLSMYNFRGGLYFIPVTESAEMLEKAGYSLTSGAKELAARMNVYNTPEIKEFHLKLLKEFSNQTQLFYHKYADKIRALYKEKSGSVITLTMLEEFLVAQNVVLTNEEKEILQRLKDCSSNPLAQQLVFFLPLNSKQIKQFNDSYYPVIRIESKRLEWEEMIQKDFGIQSGFAVDLMVSNLFCHDIADGMSLISEENMKSMQRNISNPFIANYIGTKNRETKAKIETNKKITNTGANYNEVPKTSGDKIFDAIMEKYKGKVVYVDFWATWCAPCRSGIERIKPLKDEMANENVAFVYITNQTSPKGTYDNMIPTIKGEHYRVSQDEWNNLCGKFKISGIPHYVLVGKDGKVINPQLGHLENLQLKALLMKCIKE